MNSHPRAGRPRRADAGQSPDEPAPRPIARGDGREPGSALRSQPPADPQAKRIAAAEHSLAEAYASAKAAGIDAHAVDAAFAILRDCITEARVCSDQARRDLAVVRYERYQARHRRSDPDPAVRAVVPDPPGVSLCPDPAAVQTPAQFMDAMRMYRVWAGKPSYRVMERQCGRSFAASTICTALQSNHLPSLNMVRAIIIACGGSEKDQIAFAAAWRRLTMPQADAAAPAKPSRVRALYPVN
jgi:hypothetical protein